jgi:hypothetical protein
VGGEKTRSSRFVFRPTEDYEIERRYHLTLAPTVKDAAGLSPPAAAEAFFTPAVTHLRLTAVTLDDTLTVDAFDDPLAVVDHTLTLANPVSGAAQMTVSIDFSAAIPPAERAAALAAVTLAPIFPATAAAPALLSAAWSPTASRLRLTWENLTRSTPLIDNFYELHLTPLHANGQYLQADVRLVIHIL